MFLPFFYQVYKLWSGGKQGQEAAVLWRIIWGFVEEGKKEELWIVEEGKGVVWLGEAKWAVDICGFLFQSRTAWSNLEPTRASCL